MTHIPEGNTMNNKQKTIRNFLYAALSQLIAIGFGFIIPRMWVVGYGSQVNGLISSLDQFLVYLNLFEAGVGAASLQALYRPVSEENWDDINSILAATSDYYKKTSRLYFFGLLCLAIAYPVIATSDLPYFVVFFAVLFSGLGNVAAFYFQSKYVVLLRAEGRHYLATNIVMAFNILISLTKVVLIFLGVNVVLILAAICVIQCAQVGCIVWYMRKKYPQIDLSAKPNYAAVAQKNYALVHQVVTLIFNNTDVIILTVLCGLKTVSVYAMYKMIVSHLDQVLTIVYNSVSFLLGQTRQINLERYKRMIDLTESVYSALAYAFYAVALYLYLPFMRLYTRGVTDANYVDQKLAVLFVAIALLSQSRVPMVQTIEYSGHFKQTAPRAIAEAAINLSVSLVGVALWGIYGVLLGTVAALLYRTNDIIIYANTKCLYRKPWKTYAIYLVNLLVLLSTTVVFPFLFGGLAMDSYPSLVLTAVCVTACSVAMFLLAQLAVFPHCRQGIRHILRPE